MRVGGIYSALSRTTPDPRVSPRGKCDQQGYASTRALCFSVVVLALGVSGSASAQHNGTLQGNQIYYWSGSTTFNQAFQFNYDYITVPDLTNSLGSAYSIGMRFIKAAPPGSLTILRGQGGLTANDMPQTWMGIQSNGHFVAAPYGYAQNDSGINVCDGNYHYLQVVYTPSSMTLYVDRQLAGTFPSQAIIPGGESIGASLDGNYPLQGGSVVDEISYFTGDRHAVETAVPTAPYTGTEPGLVALFHADGNTLDSASSTQSGSQTGGSGSTQGTVSTAGGTAGVLAEWSNSNTLVNSSIAEANSNAVVNETLEVHGNGNNADYKRQGTYVGWNGICCLGETDLINNLGGAAGPNIGGFMFWNVQGDGSNRQLLMLVDSYARAAFGGTSSPQSNVTVHGGITVDRDDQNTGDPFPNYYSSYGITFGDASGEGIASARPDGAPNQNGLDFFTGFGKRMSITQAGLVGIGTISPSSLLEVAGDVKISHNGALRFTDGSSLTSAAALAGLNSTNGLGLAIATTNLDPNSNGGPALSGVQNTNQMLLGWNRSGGLGEQDFIAARTGPETGGFAFYTLDPNGSTTNLVTLNGGGMSLNGNITINGQGNSLKFPDGTSLSTAPKSSSTIFRTNAGASQVNTAVDPSLLFEGTLSGLGSAPLPWGLNLLSLPWSYGADPITYHGGYHDFRISGANTQEVSVVQINSGGILFPGGNGAHITFSDGTVQSTAWTGVLNGGDYAESVDVSGSRDEFQPGDLLEIDPSNDGHFVRSSTAYSRLVGGVYATKPGVVGRRQAKAKSDQDEVPMAMVGIVPTKVSAENGPIKNGDLLVTSTTPGYAMKGTDPTRLIGAVIGKALGKLESGHGTIEVLITLQ